MIYPLKKYPILDAKRTGENITRLRMEKGLSVRQLTELMCFSTTYSIYKWENGKNMPTLENLIILAYILEVKLDDIVVTTMREL